MPDTLKYEIPPTGANVGIVSTDEVSIDGELQHLQRIKVGVGANNAYQGDLAFGQAPASNSIPVVIASDQTVPMRTDRKSTYAASTPLMTMTRLAAGNVNSVGYLWHPVSVSKTYSIKRIYVSFGGGSDGDFELRFTRITAEGASFQNTPAAVPRNGGSVASGALIRGGALTDPTRVTGDQNSFIFSADSYGAIELLEEMDLENFIARANIDEGWEVRMIVGSDITTSPKFSITFIWTEE